MTTEAGKGTFSSFASERPYRIWGGASARAVKGERVQVSLVDLDPDCLVPEHHHPAEQVGFVIEGAITMHIGDEERLLHAGETYVIPSEVPHWGRTGPEGATVIDVFGPPRDEWEALPRDEPSPARWPTV